MPQLDYTLIFNQIFWLFLVFVFLYVTIFYYFLPRLFKIFKTRNQIFTKLTAEAKTINKHFKNQTFFYKNNITNCSKITEFLQSVTYLFKKYETTSLKNQLVPSVVISFVSAKILFSQISQNRK